MKTCKHQQTQTLPRPKLEIASEKYGLNLTATSKSVFSNEKSTKQKKSKPSLANSKCPSSNESSAATFGKKEFNKHNQTTTIEIFLFFARKTKQKQNNLSCSTPEQSAHPKKEHNPGIRAHSDRILCFVCLFSVCFV
jgi:hypothetical protein